MSYGFAGFIGFGRQTGLTTAVAASGYVKAISEAVVTDIARFNPINIHGAYYEPDDDTGMKTITGNIVVPAHATEIGWFLTGAMQHLSTSSIAANYYQAIFAIGSSYTDVNSDSANVAFSVEVNRDNATSNIYTGVNISTLEFNYAPNQEVRATAGIIAYDSTTSAKTTPTFVNTPNGPFRFSSTSIAIAGAGIGNLEALTISIDHQLEGVANLDNDTRISRIARRGNPSVKLNGVISFDNFTEYNNFIAQNEQSFFIRTTKTNSFVLQFELPRVVYTSFPVNMSGRNRITAAFAGMARYHTGSGTVLKATLISTNSVW